VSLSELPEFVMNTAGSVVTLSTVGFIIFLALPAFVQAAMRFREKEIIDKLVINAKFGFAERLVYLINTDHYAQLFTVLSIAFLASGLMSICSVVIDVEISVYVALSAVWMAIFALSASAFIMVRFCSKVFNHEYVVRKMLEENIETSSHVMMSYLRSKKMLRFLDDRTLRQLLIECLYLKIQDRETHWGSLRYNVKKNYRHDGYGADYYW